jgi:hypothetical protein
MEAATSTNFDRTVPSGQLVLHDFTEIIGYESSTLKKPRNELFCVAFVENGGHAAKAYQKAINPESSDEQARKNAHKLLKKDDIRRRITELSAVIRNRTINDLIDFRLRGMKFDPAKYLSNKGAIKIHTLQEEDRIGIGLESKLVDGTLYYLPVFPSPEKSADALQKMMGLDKTMMEHSGKNGGPIQTEDVIKIYIPDNGRD